MTALLQKYFDQLALPEGELDLEWVAGLQSRHVAKYSFNSLAVQLRKPISLALEDLVQKIVVEGLGGYCFEHNKLIYEALKAKGFSVRFVIGKVLNNLDVGTPRTHRVTLLEWQGELYLVDAGFGARSPRVPVKIRDGVVSEEADRSFRMEKRVDGDFQLIHDSFKGPFILYKFDLKSYTEADCKMGNHYSAFHPDAVFVNHLVFSRILTDRILYLLNRKLQVIGAEGSEEIEIRSAAQLQKIVQDNFGILLSGKESLYLFDKTAQNAV